MGVLTYGACAFETRPPMAPVIALYPKPTRLARTFSLCCEIVTVGRGDACPPCVYPRLPAPLALTLVLVFWWCRVHAGAWWTKGWRRFGEFGREVASRVSALGTPLLRIWALKKIDDHHSRMASSSQFACPLTAHDQAHQACAYYLPLLEIPALKACEGDSKAMDAAELAKYVNKV